MKKPRKKQKQKANNVSALHKAVSLLARRSYGIHEMRRKLAGAFYEPEEIDEAVSRLVEEGYLDDGTYARAYVLDQMNLRMKGPKLIRAELIGKKVDSDTIGRVLAEQYPEERQIENIEKLIEKWKRSSVNYNRQQLIRKLIQKGYAPGLAMRALAELSDGQGFLDTP